MIGTVLNHKYRILELIGSGGMAYVYKALNMGNRRLVAIKMLKEEFKDDAEFLRRFSREATAVLNLSHENIVRAYDVGTHNGLPYIVMEYVEGHTLKDLIESNGALPVRTAIGITCQILDALQAAHHHGIIHRDVKPQNVIVTAKGKAKLADFGIAREAKASTVTFSGNKVLGSAHYISPEQAKGTLATETSDLYSVGVALYEMLTGTVPFTAESTVTVALMHIQQEPVAPIDRVPSLPLALNDIVLRALSKEPSDRYEDARAMRVDLVRSLSNPNGTFAKEPKDAAAKKQHKPVSVYLLMTLCIFIPILCIVVGGVFYLSSCGTKTDPPASDSIVPFFSPVVSAEPTPQPTEVPKNVLTVPGTLGMSLDEALHEMYEAGFCNLMVLFTTESEWAAANNTVISQTPSMRSASLPNNTVLLTVYRESLGLYKADVSFTLELSEQQSLIQIVYETSNFENIPYRVIAYERTRPSENVQLTEAATIYGYDPVTRPLILLVNGEEYAVQSATFTK